MLSIDREQDLRIFSWLLHGAGLLVVGMLLLSYQLCIRQGYDSRQQLHQEQVVELRKMLDQAPSVRAEHNRLNESLLELEALAKLVHARVPKEPREGDFLRQISEAATAEQMEIRDYRRALGTNEKTHSELEVQFVCEGGYENICRFLNRLDTMSRVVTIQQMELVSDRPGVYPVQFNLSLYFGIKDTGEDQHG